ncbi:MAG: AI-2E family transporter [Chloroflexota bacterium]
MTAASHWHADMPPPPFVVVGAGPTDYRFAPLSPRVGLLIAAGAVVALLLWMARDSVRPFIVGLLLVYLLDPVVRALARRGLPRVLAILVVYVVFILALVEFANLTLGPFVDQVAGFIRDLPTLAQRLDEQVRQLSDFYQGLNLPAGVRDAIDRAIASASEGGGIDPGILMPVVTGAGSVVGTIFGYVILPVWVFYLLKDRADLTVTFDRWLPASWRPDTWAVLRIVERTFGQWVRGQAFLGLSVGLMTLVGLVILGFVVDPVFTRYALLLSVTAGILELLPIIGPIISAVPAVLLAATAGLDAAVAALVLYTLVQQVENNFLVPKIQGDAVELHPAAVIFAIIIGGALAGLLGAILALPIASAGRSVIRYLFHRLTPDDPASMEAVAVELGIEPRPVVTSGVTAPASQPG